MKVPEPRKLSSGKWFIQLRLGGESVSISDFDRKKCIREAQAVKAEYLAGKRVEKSEAKATSLTLEDAIQNNCDAKSNVLSPATIRGYQNIKKHRFQRIMKTDVYGLARLSEEDWQKIVNDESACAAPKTIKNSLAYIRTIIKENTKMSIPDVSTPAPIVKDTAFLYADEIPTFVSAVYSTKIAVIALLALSSMRLSEIRALDWKDIKKNPDFIRTKGAVVPNENHKMVFKNQNKSEESSRNVPILIPELKQAIERDRKPFGPVMDCSRSYFLDHVHRICQENNITDVTIHGLRHSFASLAYHLQIPEQIAMEIGGWSDLSTMRKIYTHIAKKDISRYQTAMFDFYNKNAN